jgi:hypothetical protein
MTVQARKQTGALIFSPEIAGAAIVVFWIPDTQDGAGIRGKCHRNVQTN